MDPVTLWKGLAVGVAVAAPVGPMSMLCMRRTLLQGWRTGMRTGLGIATADGAYASVAALGLAGISRFMLAHERPLHAAAGLVLFYLGLKTFAAQPDKARAVPPPTLSATASYGSSVLLTLTNPPTIVSFAAIFTALAPRGGFDPTSAATTVAGVFLGSALWWLLLTCGVATLHSALGSRARRWLDRFSGVLLALFGVAELKRAA